MKQLFKADVMLPDFIISKNCYVGIDGDSIDYVGDNPDKSKYESYRELIDCVLMPGLYNMHTHTSMTLLRGVGAGLPLDRWLNEKVFPIEAKLTEDDIRVGTRIAIAEMLASGVVSFTDMYDFPRISVEEIGVTGIKANVSRPVLALDKNEGYEDNWRAKESIAFFNECNGLFDGRVKIDFAIHAEYTSTPEVVRQYGIDCKKHGAIMHLHLSETKKEHVECKERHGKTPAKYFYDLGVFDNPTVAAHCVMAELDDVFLLQESGVTVAHNPTSNMKLGSGFMPMAAMLTSGVNITLGTDGCASNNNQNLFEEMHLASIIHMGYLNDPTLLSPVELLKMATINGATAQQRMDGGSIKVGKKADIIAVSKQAPHMMPDLDTHALLVYSAQASDVKMTMVNGKILYENGEYKTIDIDEMRFDLNKSMQRLY